MDALYSLTADESSNIDMNQLERKILRGNQKCTGTIYKIRSNYEYLLVAATSITDGDDFTIDGVPWDKAEKNAIYTSTVFGVEIYEGDDGNTGYDHSNQYILMTNGQELIGKFSEVKVVDGTAMIYGVDLTEPTYHFSIETELSNSPSLEAFGGDPSGLIYWLDATDSADFTLGTGISAGRVASWKNKINSSESFSQSTASAKPLRTTVDFTTPYGGSAVTPGVLFDGGSDYLTSTDTILSTKMANHVNYYTVAVVVSGPALIDGVILDNSANVGGTLKSNYRFEIAHDGSSFAGWARCIGMDNTVANTAYETGVNLSDTASIIINTVGYDSDLSLNVDYVFSDSNGAGTAISTYNYGNYVNSTFTKYLGAANNLLGPSRFFEGYIHELMIFNNKLSVSEYGDYNLNLEQIDSIGRYLDRKWLGGTQWNEQY